MSPVIIVGLVAGASLILTAIAVFLTRKDVSIGGLGVVLLFGTVLIGMSQWRSIKVSAGGASMDLEAFEQRLEKTAAAGAEIATQAQRAAAMAETTRRQISALASQLTMRNILPVQTSVAIRAALDSAPRPDTTRLRAARDSLRNIGKIRFQPQRQ